LVNLVDVNSITTFTELGTIQRDCMEVMCTWRRDLEFVNERGEPAPLSLGSDKKSFAALCRRAGCTNDTSSILNTLRDFGTISINEEQKIVAQTPTFLL
jgi:hypothetical protein